MKESQRVYIRGNSERGDEVIKTLENLGGINLYCYHGNDDNGYFYISPDGVITYTGATWIICPFLREFYKEIKLSRWKPECGEQYFFISKIGKVIEDTWHDLKSDNLCYEFGNCFRTYDEAEAASYKVQEILNEE